MTYPGSGQNGPWPPQGPPPRGPYPSYPGGPGPGGYGGGGYGGGGFGGPPQPPRRGNGGLVAILAAVGVLVVLAIVAVVGVVIWASNRSDDSSTVASSSTTTTTTTDDYSAPTTRDLDSTATPGLPPAAPAPAPVDYYGAIAVSTQTSDVGYAVNSLSRAEAERSALSQCGVSSCQAAIWWRNACGAIVQSQADLSWGWAWATTERAASDAAATRLTGGSPKVIFSRCTSNAG